MYSRKYVLQVREGEVANRGGDGVEEVEEGSSAGKDFDEVDGYEESEEGEGKEGGKSTTAASLVWPASTREVWVVADAETRKGST